MPPIRITGVGMLFLMVCGCTDMEIAGTDPTATLSPGASAVDSKAVDAAGFFPTEPFSRTFAYSRMGPDGSTIAGTVEIRVMKIETPGIKPSGMLMEAVVHFRADGVLFSPEQATAIHPATDWPADKQRYPLQLAGISEDYGFTSRMTNASVRDASDLTLIWSSGLFGYLGMPEKPSTFEAIRVESSNSEGQTLSVRGVFRRDEATAGTFVFTYRRAHSLTSITGTLADGTMIALVEKGEKSADRPRTIVAPPGSLVSLPGGLCPGIRPMEIVPDDDVAPVGMTR